MGMTRRRLFAVTAGLAAGALVPGGVIPTTPTWQAARNGLTGDANAVDKSAQINQFLGTHPQTTIYAGNETVQPVGGGALFWPFHFDDWDYDQPFTMSGTTIGRVALPLLPVGNGADLQVSLCPDVAGAPGTPITTVRIPASWLTTVAGVGGTGPSSDVLVEASSAALATGQFNSWELGPFVDVNYQWPAVDAGGGASGPSTIYSGNYMVIAGGVTSGSVPVASVFSAPWEGTQFGQATLQPSLPVATSQPGFMATADTLVIAGGLVSGSGTANVFTASWDPSSGTVGSWSAQAALPQSSVFAGTCSVGDIVYVISGLGPSAANVSMVSYATVQNGQIGAWNQGPDLPVAVQDPVVGVVNGFLVVAGGQLPDGVTDSTAIYYAVVNADGSLGSWQAGPAVPQGVINWLGNPAVLTDNAIVQSFPGGSGWGTWILPFTADGPGTWWHYGSTVETGSWNSAIFPADDTSYSLIAGMGTSKYLVSNMFPVPRLSVPLPTTGLTNGATYHILMQQQGGDLNNYLRTLADPQALPGNPTALYRARGSSGSWTSYTAQYSVPLAVFDKTIGGQPWHTWDDSGARISTLVHSTTGDARLLGGLESVLAPDGTTVASAWRLTYPVDAGGTAPVAPGMLWPPTEVVQL